MVMVNLNDAPNAILQIWPHTNHGGMWAHLKDPNIPSIVSITQKQHLVLISKVGNIPFSSREW